MTISPLFRPRATLAAVLLAGASFALQSNDDAERSEHGWMVTRTGSDTAALAPSPSLFRADGSFVGESVRFEATVQPPLPGRYRLHVSTENVAVNLDLRDTNDGADAALFEVYHDDLFGHATPPAAQEFFTEWFDSDGSPFEMFVVWTTLEEGPVRGRILWEREFDERGGFPPEPISSHAVLASEGPLGSRVEHEALLEKKGCWNCHEALVSDAQQRPAPVLDRIRQRAGSAWVRDWIASPQAVRPGADMPQVLFGTPDEIDEQATALARFLESLSDAPEVSGAATEPGVLKRGRDLYHAVGCVACHGALVTPAKLLDDPYSPNELPADAPLAPFGALEGKWRPAGLAAFLKDPLATHPDGRMPSLNLDDEEADSIANYLADHFGPARDLEGAATDEQLALGRKLFVAQRCNACHTLATLDLPQLDSAGPIAGHDGSDACLNDALPTERNAAPHYDFDAATRGALTDLLSTRLAFPAADADLPSRHVALAMERHACRACHVADGHGGPADDAKVYFWTAEEETDLGDEGRFPPELSGVGHKLTTSWMREVLTAGGVARPYMATRMPQFGADHMDGLAELFAAQEGLVPDTDVAPPELNDELVMTGRELMGLDKMACVTCHVYKDFPPLSTPGPDMTAFAERLRYEWWRGYIHDPQRYKPGTRMPSFGTGNVSSFKDVLDGDLTQQADALWAYMNLGDFMPVPEGLESDREMKIVVGERPVVFRAFLPMVGSRGIAVGFPNGLHIGYDAANARLVDAWQGDFLDASGSWAGRGGMESGGLGETVWSAPSGPVLLLEHPSGSWPETQPDSSSIQFHGYRLDPDGVPVFESTLDGVRVEERIETQVTPRRGIRRHFRLSGLTDRKLIFVRGQVDPDSLSGGELVAYVQDFDVDITAWKAVEDPKIDLAVQASPDSDIVEFVLEERF
jgi:mono/diheme cytochrome c family protein